MSEGRRQWFSVFITWLSCFIFSSLLFVVAYSYTPVSFWLCLRYDLYMKLSVHIFDTIHVVIVKSKYLYGHELVNGVHFGSIERKI